MGSKRLTKPAAEMLKLLRAGGERGIPLADLVRKWIDYNQLAAELRTAGYKVTEDKSAAVLKFSC